MGMRTAGLFRQTGMNTRTAGLFRQTGMGMRTAGLLSNGFEYADSRAFSVTVKSRCLIEKCPV
jgi:hypothetical protein